MAIRKITVSRDESIYEAWPDVAMTNSGKLIAIFTECEHHLNRDKIGRASCRERVYDHV